jgi:integrase
MATRRSQGEGGVHWSESRQRWVATAQLGFRPNGKRMTRTAAGRTKTEAKNKLKQLLRDKDDGITESTQPTVADALEEWLRFGLSGRSAHTVTTCSILTKKHILPELGPRKLQALTADDVDRWLAKKSLILSTATLQRLLSILRRAIAREQARDRVRRNVAMLCGVPTGATGRPSKSLNLEQSRALLDVSKGAPAHAYIVLSLLTGARTEELRALTWAHVDLIGRPDDDPPTPPSIELWRSVREGGDTKTRQSRRTLSLPHLCVEALTRHQQSHNEARDRAGDRWVENDLVFSTALGGRMDAANIRRALRTVAKKAGLDPTAWTPRELRHSFVSLMSDAGVPLENIARLVGHRNTTVTELVYRKQLRPVMTEGAETMNRLFSGPG